MPKPVPQPDTASYLIILAYFPQVSFSNWTQIEQIDSKNIKRKSNKSNSEHTKQYKIYKYTLGKIYI